MLFQQYLLLFCVSLLSVDCIEDSARFSLNFCGGVFNGTKFFKGTWPLMLPTQNRSLVITSEKAKFAIVDMAEIVLSCAPHHLIEYPGKQFVYVTCDGRTNKFSYDGVRENIEHFACDLRVIEEVKSDVRGCGKPEYIATNFGYEHPVERKSIVLGEACYDKALGRTVFVHIQMGPGNLPLKKLPANFFNVLEHRDSSYKLDFLRKLNFDIIYTSMEKELNMQYSAPLELSHFIDPAQWMNIQFKGVQKLGWNYFVKFESEVTFDALRRAIRLLSVRKGLDVYVGGHGVSVLTHNHKSMELYVDSSAKRYPIPKILWILVKNKHKAMGFIMLNNKNDGTSVNPAKCTVQCEQITWLDLKVAVEKYLMCCTYAQMKNIIPDMPDIINLTKPLY